MRTLNRFEENSYYNSQPRFSVSCLLTRQLVTNDKGFHMCTISTIIFAITFGIIKQKVLLTYPVNKVNSNSHHFN